MKLHAIIGKKQIVLASLVLILGIAIYLNWQFASNDQTLSVAELLNGSSSTSSNYGQAELVGTDVNDENYFEKARLEKEKSRGEATETLSNVLDKADLSAEEISSATSQALSIAQVMETETNIENMIKAKGFDDCIAYLNNNKANIVVKVTDMTAAQAAQIKEIIVAETSIEPSNITITPVE